MITKARKRKKPLSASDLSLPFCLCAIVANGYLPCKIESDKSGKRSQKAQNMKPRTTAPASNGSDRSGSSHPELVGRGLSFCKLALVVVGTSGSHEEEKEEEQHQEL